MQVNPGTVADRILKLIAEEERTVADIVESGINPSTAAAYLSRLEKAGLIVSVMGDRPRKVFDQRTILRSVKVYRIKEEKEND